MQACRLKPAGMHTCHCIRYLDAYRYELRREKCTFLTRVGVDTHVATSIGQRISNSYVRMGTGVGNVHATAQRVAGNCLESVPPRVGWSNILGARVGVNVNLQFLRPPLSKTI